MEDGGKMKKKICFFSGDITRCGGTERVAIRIANALSETEKYEVCFLSLVEREQEPFFHVNESIPRYKLGNRWIQPGPGYLLIIRKVYRFLLEHKIDVIIDIDIVLDILSIPATRHLDTKVLSWEHFNMDYEFSVQYRKWILRYSVKRSDYVVVLTKQDLENYQQRLGRRERIDYIYNPLDKLDDFQVMDRKKWILSVGRLVKEKGYDKLMRVAAEVLPANPDWQWLILGEGELRPDLEQFIAEHHFQNRLILTGRVSDVDSYLRQGSLFVSTSVFEGFGMNILEAKRMGVPCVSFSITGPQEILRDGVDGYLIPPFRCDEMVEKINHLISDSDTREEFSKQAAASIEAFEISKILDQWLGILKQLTEES